MYERLLALSANLKLLDIYWFNMIVLSAAQYSKVVRIFDILTFCYKTISDHCSNNFRDIFDETINELIEL